MKLLLVLAAACVLLAAAPKRDWKPATILETAHALQREPPVQMFGNVPDPANTGPSFSLALSPTAWLGLRIDTPGMVFEVMCAARGSRMPDVTLHGPVKYAIEKGKFYLLDDSGREWQMAVLEKVLKP